MATRLPFSAPGTSRAGEGDAGLLLAEARRQLYFTKLIADAAGVPVFRQRRVLEDGSVVMSSVAGPIERIHVELPKEEEDEVEEETSYKMSRLAWLPEGFVITPRTGTATNGFGMPPTADGLGTPGGPLKQVIINRFKDNQYPDAIATEIIGPQDPGMRTFCVAPLFFMDWELSDKSFGIGVWKVDKFFPQFSARWVPNYREAETGTWYCHRPMYALDSERQVHKTIREETNEVRAIAGKLPVNPPVRGHENGLSEAISYMMGYGKSLAHDSPKFRDGYRTFVDGRFTARFGEAGTVIVITPSSSAGENLYIKGSTAEVGQARLGKDAVQWWRNSAPHYANIIYDWGLTTQHYAAIESATARETKGLTERQLPPYNEGSPVEALEPPAKGYTAAQIFIGMQNFVAPSQVGQEGDFAVGIASPFFTQGHGYFPRVAMNYVANGVVLVHFKGRSIEVFKNDATNGVFTITAAKMVVSGGAATKLRVAGHWRTGEAAANHYIRVYEGDAHDFKATRVLIGTFLLPADMGQMSIPKFSASGERMVFSYTDTVSESSVVGLGSTVAQNLTDGTTTTATTNNDRVWGETLHFIEFNGASFSEIGTAQSVDITVSRWVTGIHQQCAGEYKVFADYAGEAVVYATAVIDSETSQSGGGGAYSETVRLRGELRFPNGETIEYTHTDTGAGLEVTGFFRHFLYLDIMRPERCAYMQYDVSGAETHVLRMSLYAHGQLVKSKDNVGKPNPDPLYARITVGFTVVGGLVSLGAARFHPVEALNIGGADVIRVNPVSKAPAAAATHKASLVSTISFTSDVQIRGSSAYPNADCVGPSVVMGAPVAFGLTGVTDFSAAFYKGEYLYAGYVSNTIRANMLGGNSGWEGADQYFWSSSLPLEVITSLPNLSRNILPIGTL